MPGLFDDVLPPKKGGLFADVLRPGTSGPDLSKLPGWQQGEVTKDKNFTPAKSPGEAMTQALPGGGGLGEKYLKHAGESALDYIGKLVKGFGDVYERGKTGEPISSEELIPQAVGMAQLATGTSPANRVRAPVATTAKVETPTLDKIERTIGKPRAAEDMGGEIEKGVLRGKSNQEKLTNVLYQRAKMEPGEFDARAFRDVGTKFRQEIGQEHPDVVVDKLTTPQSSHAMDYLDKGLSQLKIENKVGPGQPNPESIVGINLRGIEQVRKGLNKMRKRIAYDNESDKDAFRIIMKKLDDHIEKTIENGLFSGDPKVLDMIRDARISASQGFKLYGPGQRGDSVTATIRKIIDGHKDPTAIANLLIGVQKVGSGATAGPLVDRLQLILKEPEMNAIREAMFTAAKNQKAGLHQLAYTRIGEKLFDPYQIKLMRQYLAAKDKPPSVRARIGTAMEKAVVHGLSRALPGHTLRTIAKTGYEMSRKKYGGVE